MPCFVVEARSAPGRYRRHAAILTGDHDEGRDRRRRNTGVPGRSIASWCQTHSVHRDGPWLIHAGEGYRLDLLVGDDPLDGNIDIEVTLDSDSSRWSGTVFTVENLAALLDRHESSTGKSTAQYVWADGMVVVPSLDPDAIVAVVEELLRSGEYRDALTFLEDDGSVDDAILRHQAGQGDELAQWALGTSEKMEGTT